MQGTQTLRKDRHYKALKWISPSQLGNLNERLLTVMELLMNELEKITIFKKLVLRPIL